MPPTDARTLCRRLGGEYVDILGLTNQQLARRQAWCREQAARLAPAVNGVNPTELQEELVKAWDISVAEAAWVVNAL
jgi:hypothetical protein